MTPFALQLRAARTEYGITQGDFANRVGYRQSYISAIECGTKLPKDTKLIERTVLALDLDDDGANALREALQRSQSHRLPPPGSPAFAYDICAQLSAVMPGLTQAHAKVLRQAIAEVKRIQRQSNIAPVQPASEVA